TARAARWATKECVDLIARREAYEWQLGRLPTARLIPLGQLPSALSTLDSTRDIVVYCRSGKRSADATIQLRAAGFRAVNLAGGILRWSGEVDPTTAKYCRRTAHLLPRACRTARLPNGAAAEWR